MRAPTLHAPRRVLAYTTRPDRDDPALCRAIHLARTTGCHITVAHVDPLHSMRRMRRLRGRLAQQVDRMQRLGLATDLAVAAGPPPVELVRMAVAGDYDLVIKTAEMHDPRRGRFFGSTASQLLRHCPCPVWIAQEGEWLSVRRVLAAVELDGADCPASALARDVVAAAIETARRERAELYLFNARPPASAPIISRVRGGLPRAQARSGALDPGRDEGLEQLRAELGARDVGLHVVPNAPGAAVGAVAEHLDVDLVVIGTDGPGGLADLLRPSTLDRAVRAIPRAVLAVKPADYVSKLAAPQAIAS
jgi:nucleotide-binding universal stress UspA family protein